MWEPGFPVSRGKQVLVVLNEVPKVDDHDFNKVSIIPAALLIHDLLKVGRNHI